MRGGASSPGRRGSPGLRCAPRPSAPGRPRSFSASRVPPVERSWNPRSTRPCAKGTSPRLSETLRRASTGPAIGWTGDPGRSTAPGCQRTTSPRSVPPRTRRRGRLRRLSSGTRGGSVLGGLAQLEQAAGLHLADALAGEVHDLPHLLERDAALLRHVQRAGVLQLPDLLVREVELDRPGLGVHVQVEVVLAGDEQARPRAVDAVGAGLAAGCSSTLLEQLLPPRDPPRRSGGGAAGRAPSPCGTSSSSGGAPSGPELARGLARVPPSTRAWLRSCFPPPDRLTAELVAGGVTTIRSARRSRRPAAR